jgi:hypothetical protein
MSHWIFFNRPSARRSDSHENFTFHNNLSPPLMAVSALTTEKKPRPTVHNEDHSVSFGQQSVGVRRY